jgi:hypothetical protein
VLLGARDTVGDIVLKGLVVWWDEGRENREFVGRRAHQNADLGGEVGHPTHADEVLFDGLFSSKQYRLY